MDEATTAEVVRIAEVTKGIQSLFMSRGMSLQPGDCLPLAMEIHGRQELLAQANEDMTPSGPPG